MSADQTDLIKYQAEQAARAICGEVVKPYAMDTRTQDSILQAENDRLRVALIRILREEDLTETGKKIIQEALK